MRKAGDVMADIFGKSTIPAAGTILVRGDPAKGKSHLATSMTEDGTWSNPLMIAAEEGLGKSLADRFARQEATLTTACDAKNFPEICLALDQGKFDVCLIDSVTSANVSPGNVAVLRKTYPRLTVIAVLQSVKSGGHRGSQAWLHDADVSIHVFEKGKWRVEKSWWSETGREGEVKL